MFGINILSVIYLLVVQPKISLLSSSCLWWMTSPSTSYHGMVMRQWCCETYTTVHQQCSQLTQRLESQQCVSGGDDSVSDVTYENSVDTEARHVKHTELSSFILNVYWCKTGHWCKVWMIEQNQAVQLDWISRLSMALILYRHFGWGYKVSV